MKKIVSLIVTLLTIATLANTYTTTAYAATTPEVKLNDNGTITVDYDYNYTNRVKVLVSKDSKTYQYELTTGNNDVELPLSEGNGTYTVTIAKNTEGTKYAVVKKFTINATNTNEVFTTANQIVNYDADDAAIELAAELTKDATNEAEKVEAIYEYVVNNYSYDYNKINTIAANTTYVPSIEDTFTAKTGICYDISTLVAAMLRSVDVECKVVKGYTPAAATYHAWNQVKVNGQWETMDVTYDVQIDNNNMFKAASLYSDVRYAY